ncbi:MmcQ/YjbR family DNA-binding protein [Carnobacteriaceae bacterium zg-ZUI252]|nr:MmcQ/YjbR family DNA-binding protein [Carnobacteriaceae bacterium zg-ZUI252]
MRHYKTIDLTHYQINEDALKTAGFIDGVWTTQYKKIIHVIFSIDENTLTIDVMDCEMNDIYFPVYQQTIFGEFTAELIQHIDEMIQHLFLTCFIRNRMKQRLQNYIEQTFGVTPVSPFKNIEHFAYTKNGKWFCLFIELRKEDSHTVELVNVKIDPSKIETLLTYPFILPAYHMNKKHWVSIRLDDNTDFEMCCRLVKDSFNLV